MLAEEGLKHFAVGAIQGGQAHEQTGVMHDVLGSADPHVLLQELLDDRVELVNCLRA